MGVKGKVTISENINTTLDSLFTSIEMSDFRSTIRHAGILSNYEVLTILKSNFYADYPLLADYQANISKLVDLQRELERQPNFDREKALIATELQNRKEVIYFLLFFFLIY